VLCELHVGTAGDMFVIGVLVGIIASIVGAVVWFIKALLEGWK
jgi:hypothetical protein